MPAINVSKSDTFEIQRQKINELGQQVFGITQGGSDLTTGNLKLGDGSVSSPALSFISEDSLGIYKDEGNSLGIATGSIKLTTFSKTGIFTYKNLVLKKSGLFTDGVSILNGGSNYESGTYTGVPLLGGLGEEALATIGVTEFTGAITNLGSEYLPGTYSNILLAGGSGTGATVSFVVSPIEGVITNAGSNYTAGFYSSVSLTNGSGTGAIADIIVNSSGQISDVLITNSGSNYNQFDTLSANSSDIGSTGSGFVFTISNNPKTIQTLIFTSKGSGYQSNNILELPGLISGITTTLDTESSTITVSSANLILPGYNVTVSSGTGQLASNTTVVSVDTRDNIITLSQAPTTSGSATLVFTPPFGAPVDNFEYTINSVGVIDSVSITSPGNDYLVNDQLTIDPKKLINDIIFEVQNKTLITITLATPISSSLISIGDEIKNLNTDQNHVVYGINVSGANIESLVVDSGSFSENDSFRDLDDPLSQYQISSVSNSYFRFFINTGNGLQLTPNFTLFSGNTYIFDLSDPSNVGHIFALSKYRDGIWGPSLIENVITNFSTSSKQITVPDSTGILVGMSVRVTSGTGNVSASTVVESVNGNTITLSDFPTSSGSSVVTFRGTEYTTNVTRTPTSLKIVIADNTPNLYYYCAVESQAHQNEGGEDNQESLITINLNNPRVFGSGVVILVNEVDTSDSITATISTGTVQAQKYISSEGVIDSIISETLLSEDIETTNLVVQSVNSSTSLTVTTPVFDIVGNVNIGSTIQANYLTGNITTSGILRTNNLLNVNNILTISNNTISTASNNNIVLTPATSRVVKINTSTALNIPSGSTAQRPSAGVVENGSIRFNTDTGQYEGYTASSNTWSSLGGVRDLDGNTYITAEEFTGANDNRLWFYNDNINTIRITRNYQEFVGIRRLRSLNPLAPAYTDWTANTPVTLGSYLKYKSNIYEVTTAGTTGGVQNPPTHTVGTVFSGTAQLTYFTTAVAPLIFEEISELSIGPDKDVPLVISNEIKLQNDSISTLTEDLRIIPAESKKVKISAPTSLVIPSGTSNQRGSAEQGSIRFNTSISQYEGYDGVNWSSLGGVRDVDGNTYIIPELSAGSNENTLYFYNDGSNTLRLTTNSLEFDEVSSISSSSDILSVDVPLVTFNSLALSIDNSSSESSFISSTKDNLDLGLSQGLNNDTLLRLSNTGDVYFNIGFGTGVYDGVKIFDKDLKEFEISKYKITSEFLELVKGTNDSGSVIIYSPSIHNSAKVEIIVHDLNTDNKEFIEYSVTNKGSDIYYTEYGNIRTNGELVTSIFDFSSENNVRVTFTLNPSIVFGSNVEITVISNIIKR